MIYSIQLLGNDPVHEPKIQLFNANRKGIRSPSSDPSELTLSVSQHSPIVPSFDWQCMITPMSAFSGPDGLANRSCSPPDSSNSAV